jgi:hypothetical protein
MPINGSSICKFPGENGVYKELNCRKSSGDNYGDKGMLRGCSVNTGYFLWQREEEYWSIDQFAIKENRTVQQNHDFCTIQKNYIESSELLFAIGCSTNKITALGCKFVRPTAKSQLQI